MPLPLLSFEDFSISCNSKRKYLDAVRRWFPLYPSKELSQIAATLMTDGHIDFYLRDGRPKISKIILYSNDPAECGWFLALVFQEFGIRGKLIQYVPSKGYSQKPSYKAVVSSSMLARLFVRIGVPCGDKTLASFDVPPWIAQGDTEIKRAFLGTIFNFDGSISMRSRREAAVELNFVNNKHSAHLESGNLYFQQIKRLLSEFGVDAGKVHIRHCMDEKYTLMLFITNRRSILNFAENLTFISERKSSRMRVAVSSIKKRIRVRGGTEILRLLQEKMGTDRAAVKKINLYSKVPYTSRQFEHMRRGESLVPVDMVHSALIALGKKAVYDMAFIESLDPH